MTNLRTKVGSIVATSALVLSIVPGVFAASNVEITVTGNGAHSNQDVNLTLSNDTTVKQSNTTEVTNIQSANSSTGGNSITGTTGEGGDPSIETGKATSTNLLKVTGGSNTAIANDCGCEPTALSVDVSKNGAKTKTKVTLKVSSKNTTDQKN